MWKLRGRNKKWEIGQIEREQNQIEQINEKTKTLIEHFVAQI